MILQGKVYDILKWLCLIVLPALATFYNVLASLWDLPYPMQICETITAVATLIGCIIGVSSVNYYDKKEKELEEARRLNGQDEN